MTVSKGLLALRMAGLIGRVPYRVLRLLVALVGGGRPRRRP